jgi:hypothetical protein
MKLPFGETQLALTKRQLVHIAKQCNERSNQMKQLTGSSFAYQNWVFRIQNPDPDPPDQHVLCLPDPDSDPLVRGMDPDPDPDHSVILLSSSKNSKKTLIPTVLDFFMTFIFEI